MGNASYLLRILQKGYVWVGYPSHPHTREGVQTGRCTVTKRFCIFCFPVTGHTPLPHPTTGTEFMYWPHDWTLVT